MANWGWGVKGNRDGAQILYDLEETGTELWERIARRGGVEEGNNEIPMRKIKEQTDYYHNMVNQKAMRWDKSFEI